MRLLVLRVKPTLTWFCTNIFYIPMDSTAYDVFCCLDKAPKDQFLVSLAKKAPPTARNSDDHARTGNPRYYSHTKNGLC